MDPPRLRCVMAKVAVAPENCLALAVLTDSGKWLGSPSPMRLEQFLYGAYFRAGLTTPKLPVWRIFGPLTNPDFSTPLLARTGRPSLTIRWAIALEFLHFNMADAMAELAELAAAWFDAGRFDSTEQVGAICKDDPNPVAAFWDAFVHRPGMFLGNLDSWSLYCFLHGMRDGGDWLALPALDRLEEAISTLERDSDAAYGSAFAAYRVYGSDASKLLEQVAAHVSRASGRQEP